MLCWPALPPYNRISSEIYKPYPGRMDSMLAASLPSPGSLTLVRRPLPILGPRDVLLRVEATTLCGTDLRIVTGQKTHGVTPGVILGHEIAARVWKLGVDLRPGIDAPAPGTQVGLAPEIACGHCVPCTAGRSNVCALAAAAGASVMACGRPARLDPALALGASTVTASQGDELVATVREWSGGAGADVVIIAVGDPGLVPIAAQCTAIGGYISCFAGFPAGTLAQIDPNLIHYRELTISGSANATLEDYAAAVATLSTGALDLSPLITHEFPLTQVDAALDAVRSRAGLKVAVRPGRNKPTER